MEAPGQVLDRNVILYEGVKAVLPAHYGSGARNWTQQRLSIGERTQTTASQSMLLSASTNSKPEKPEAALQRDRQNVLMVRASPGLMLKRVRKARWNVRMSVKPLFAAISLMGTCSGALPSMRRARANRISRIVSAIVRP